MYNKKHFQLNDTSIGPSDLSNHNALIGTFTIKEE